MLKRMTRALVLAAAALSAGCGEAGSGDKIVIGAAGPWTEGYGIMARRGIDLALEELNATEAFRDRPLVVQAFDDKANGETGAQVAQQLVSADSIVAVVGHLNSGAMIAASKIYEGKIAAVGVSTSSPELTGISPWLFRVISSDSSNAADLAEYANRTGKTRVALLYENDAYGRGLVEAFRRGYKGQVVSLDPITAEERDFSVFVQYYQQRRPDLVFVAGLEGTGLAFLKAAKAARLGGDFMGSDGWSGLTIDTTASDGAIVGTPFSPLDQRAGARAFVAAFRKKYDGMNPDDKAALAYDATKAVALAIRKVGPDRKKIRDYLAAIPEQDVFEGATGRIRFRPDGDPENKSIVVTRIRRGAFVVEGDSR